MFLHQTKKLVILVIVIGIILPILFFVGRKKQEEKVPIPIEPETIRKAVVADMFYPAEKSTLNAQVEGFFQEVPEGKEEGLMRILIVPHAGYEYSGQVAAWGFKSLADKDYSRVVLLGGSHRALFEGAMIDENDAWETPLGLVETDKDLAKKLVEAVEGVAFSASAHFEEHSLEVELPFLQTVFKDFKLVPSLLGETDEALLEKLAVALAQNMTENTLVVVSTDLSHYPPYEIANQVDSKTIDAILNGDVESFKATISAQMAQGYSGLDTCACGERAVRVGMKLAQKLGKGEWKLMKYANSGDVSGDKNRVVGYAAIGWYEKAKSEELNKEEQAKLIEIAKKTLESYLENGKTPEFKVEEPKLLEPLGAFVTLRKNGELRGCIGEFEAKEPLWKVVRRMAIKAATKDPRFPLVRLNELPKIKLEISVLSPLKKTDDPDKIEIGVHGVMIKKGLRKGVFLPQVATETGWDKETFMGQLCSQKAGLPWDCWKKKDVELFIFTAQVFEEESELKH